MSWSAHSARWHNSHCLGSGWLKENRFRIIVEMQKSFTVGENDYDEDGEWEEREMMAFSGKREKMEHWMHNQLTAWSPEHRSSLPSRVDSTVCLMLLKPRKLSRHADCLKKNLLLAIRVRFSIGSLIAHLSFFQREREKEHRKLKDNRVSAPLTWRPVESEKRIRSRNDGINFEFRATLMIVSAHFLQVTAPFSRNPA